MDGAAVFRHARGPAHVSYAIRCDRSWRTLRGRILGFVGERTIDCRVARDRGGWMLNGAPVAGMDHLFDLDLGFTPATNLQQLRRVAMTKNEAVPLPVAWFDIDAGTLTELPQIYERRDADLFWYQAPGVGYEGMLELAPNGFVRRYPDLWEAERFA